MEWKSGERRISVGWPATGLSSSSASDWANRFLAFEFDLSAEAHGAKAEKWLFVPSRIAASQGVSGSFLDKRIFRAHN
jgi:hypothetical protein